MVGKKGLGKYERMIRTKDITEHGLEIIDEKHNLVRKSNHVEGLLVVDLGLIYALKHNGGFKKEFIYAESTAQKKLRLDYWKKMED